MFSHIFNKVTPFQWHPLICNFHAYIRKISKTHPDPSNTYLFKVNDRDTAKRCEINSNLPTIFYQIFISHQMIALQKLRKMFFISSKKLFSFSRYSNFCISIFPFFLFFSLSAIALKVDGG